MQHIDAWINVLKRRYRENPQAFGSGECASGSQLFPVLERAISPLQNIEPDHKGLGRVLPGGAELGRQALGCYLDIDP
ncbi:hypothetical protein Bca4012_048025 [Brassica carinata]